jgi:hypothetical protein
MVYGLCYTRNARIMTLYQIIGLTQTPVVGISYKTDDNLDIMRDDDGKYSQKSRMFANYILYARFENAYYAIHLSKYDCVSVSGKRCYIGMMNILHTNYECIRSNITHVPIEPIFISAKLDIKKYDCDDQMDVYLHVEPDTCVFRFSSIGTNAREPRGYAYVNMDLFQVSPIK